MIELIITLLIALGQISSAAAWEQLTPTEQQSLINNIIIDDVTAG